ncbi:hypothetical protein BC830DRAFT_265622 [Chytriomyces sp. MP71]|nr:hypothetical protein BC830DRAFT_265622 [Chytriomyces sp. MP71]
MRSSPDKLRRQAMPPCQQEQQEYLASTLASMAPDDCDAHVLTKMEAFASECNDAFSFPFSFQSLNSHYSDPVTMVAFCLKAHGISLPVPSPQPVTTTSAPPSATANSTSPDTQQQQQQSNAPSQSLIASLAASLLLLAILLLLLFRARARRNGYKLMKPLWRLHQTHVRLRDDEDGLSDAIPLYVTSSASSRRRETNFGHNLREVEAWTVEEVAQWARGVDDLGSDVAMALKVSTARYSYTSSATRYAHVLDLHFLHASFWSARLKTCIRECDIELEVWNNLVLTYLLSTRCPFHDTYLHVQLEDRIIILNMVFSI